MQNCCCEHRPSVPQNINYHGIQDITSFTLAFIDPILPIMKLYLYLRTPAALTICTYAKNSLLPVS